MPTGSITPGGTAFNGGKITGKITDPDQGAVSVYIIPAGGNATALILKAGGIADDFFDILGVYTFDNSGSLILSSDAQLRLTHTDVAESAMIVHQLHVGSAVAEFQNHAGSPVLQVQESGQIVAPSIPTADPHVAGSIYSLSGTLHISAG